MSSVVHTIGGMPVTTRLAMKMEDSLQAFAVRAACFIGELDVPFFKRAQLTAADLSLALGAKGRGAFRDLNRLTIFADHLVPHVLRIDGVLAYGPGLAARIDREDLITPGSPEEVEIRAAAVHAVELMRESLARHGLSVTSMGLDYVLWNRGQQRHYKTIKPRHRARTVYY